MKILYVIHGLPPKENGGVENYTFHLSQALKRSGHQIILFCRAEDHEKEEFSCFYEEVEGLRVIRVVNNLTKINNPRILYDNHFFNQYFIKTLKQEQPDLVHFQHIFSLSGNLVTIAKNLGFPVIFTFHDFFVFCHRIQFLKENLTLCGGPLFGFECVSCVSPFPLKDIRTRLLLKAKDILPLFFIKWTKNFFIPQKYLEDQGYEVFHRYRYMFDLLSTCNLLLTPSQYVKSFFLRQYPPLAKKIEVLPLGIPPFEQGFFPKKRRDKIRFCYFGAILPHKGAHILLDAFKSLPKGKAILTIYGGRNKGNQDYFDNLIKQAVGFDVVFRGSYKREDLPIALSDQDVMVMPAIWPETFSIVIREANLLGLPVIASRIGAIPEAVREGVNGFLFRPGDIDELSRQMARFIANPIMIQEMASRMPKPKSMVEHAQELIEIYKRVISEKR